MSRKPIVATMVAMTIDEAIHPYAGPCAVCGSPDKRHRLFDAVREQHRAGDPTDMLADLYDLTPERVEWIIAQPRFPRLLVRPAVTDA